MVVAWHVAYFKEEFETDNIRVTHVGFTWYRRDHGHTKRVTVPGKIEGDTARAETPFGAVRVAAEIWGLERTAGSLPGRGLQVAP